MRSSSCEQPTTSRCATRPRSRICGAGWTLATRPARPDRGPIGRSHLSGGAAHWLAAVALTLVVLGLAVSVLRPARRRPAQASHKPQGTVMGLLGVLHQPETNADRTVTSAMNFAGLQAYALVRPLLRYATTTLWGTEIFIVAPPIDGMSQGFAGGPAPSVRSSLDPFVGELVEVAPSPPLGGLSSSNREARSPRRDRGRNCGLRSGGIERPV
jgi:hypothetical protein